MPPGQFWQCQCLRWGCPSSVCGAAVGSALPAHELVSGSRLVVSTCGWRCLLPASRPRRTFSPFAPGSCGSMYHPLSFSLCCEFGTSNPRSCGILNLISPCCVSICLSICGDFSQSPYWPVCNGPKPNSCRVCNSVMRRPCSSVGPPCNYRTNLAFAISLLGHPLFLSADAPRVAISAPDTPLLSYLWLTPPYESHSRRYYASTT
jgi:hypothetical protein